MSSYLLSTAVSGTTSDCKDSPGSFYCAGGSSPSVPYFCRAGLKYNGAAQSDPNDVCTPLTTDVKRPATSAELRDTISSSLKSNKACNIYYQNAMSLPGCSCGLGYVKDGLHCAVCPAGYKCGSSSDMAEMTPCQGSAYCAPGTADTGLTSTWTYFADSCPAGTYALSTTADGQTVNACANCVPGTFSAIGATLCTACAAGTTSIAGAASCAYAITTAISATGVVTYPNNCPAGTYAASATSGCVACDNGYYSSTAGATACTIAPAGMFAYRSADFGGFPAALFISPLGSANAMPCVPGSYTGSAGKKTCSQCPAGGYAPPTVADALTGEPNNGPGPTSCTSCSKHAPKQGTTGADGKGINAAACY